MNEQRLDAYLNSGGKQNTGQLVIDDRGVRLELPDGTVRLAIPFAGLHSVARGSGTQMHLWHGSTRYKVSIGRPSDSHTADLAPAAPGVLDLLYRVADGGAEQRAVHTKATVADAIAGFLQQRQGPPPAGLKVRPPWSSTRVFVTAAIGVVGLIAAILVIYGLATR